MFFHLVHCCCILLSYLITIHSQLDARYLLNSRMSKYRLLYWPCLYIALISQNNNTFLKLVILNRYLCYFEMSLSGKKVHEIQ